MKLLLLFSFLIYSNFSFAIKLKEYINSVSLQSSMPSVRSSYTYYKNGGEQEIETEFKSNVNGYYKLILDAKYFSAGVTFPTGAVDELESSKLSDTYIQTTFNKIRLRYENSSIRGGYIEDGPLRKEDVFYKDYGVETTNIDISYFFDSDYQHANSSPITSSNLKIKKKSGYFDSWIASIGKDSRKTTFPNLNSNESLTVFSVENSNLIQSFESESIYLAFGYGGLHQVTQKFRYYFHILFGNGQQETSAKKKGEELHDYSQASYIDYTMGFDYLVTSKSSLGLKADTYTLENKIDNSSVNTYNSRIYLFWDYYL